MAWAKTSSHERGYGAAWRKLRLLVLRRDNGLCIPCNKVGKLTPAVAVDHIISRANGKKMGLHPSHMEQMDNLQSICQVCHDIKSAAEEGRTLEPLKVTGADGWKV